MQDTRKTTDSYLADACRYAAQRRDWMCINDPYRGQYAEAIWGLLEAASVYPDLGADSYKAETIGEYEPIDIIYLVRSDPTAPTVVYLCNGGRFIVSSVSGLRKLVI